MKLNIATKITKTTEKSALMLRKLPFSYFLCLVTHTSQPTPCPLQTLSIQNPRPYPFLPFPPTDPNNTEPFPNQQKNLPKITSPRTSPPNIHRLNWNLSRPRTETPGPGPATECDYPTGFRGEDSKANTERSHRNNSLRKRVVFSSRQDILYNIKLA